MAEVDFAGFDLTSFKAVKLGWGGVGYSPLSEVKSPICFLVCGRVLCVAIGDGGFGGDVNPIWANDEVDKLRKSPISWSVGGGNGVGDIGGGGLDQTWGIYGLSSGGGYSSLDKLVKLWKMGPEVILISAYGGDESHSAGGDVNPIWANEEVDKLLKSLSWYVAGGNGVGDIGGGGFGWDLDFDQTWGIYGLSSGGGYSSLDKLVKLCQMESEVILISCYCGDEPHSAGGDQTDCGNLEEGGGHGGSVGGGNGGGGDDCGVVIGGGGSGGGDGDDSGDGRRDGRGRGIQRDRVQLLFTVLNNVLTLLGLLVAINSMQPNHLIEIITLDSAIAIFFVGVISLLVMALLFLWGIF